MKKVKRCNASIEFGDDFGDNSCTFHCELPFNHVGQHQETGDMFGNEYRLVWEEKQQKVTTKDLKDDDEAREERPHPSFEDGV